MFTTPIHQLASSVSHGYSKAMDRIYFDWAATAIPDTEIIEQVKEINLQYPENPSSTHKGGKAARKLLEDCRERCALQLGVKPNQIIFTSGGTESDNLILQGLLFPPRSGGLLTSNMEHPAIWRTAQVLKEFKIPVKEINTGLGGILDVENTAEALTNDIKMVSLMATNNETGARQPMAELVKALRAVRTKGPQPLIHSDAVQALGKERINLAEWGVDSASFSGHKIGAPRGVGILFLNKERKLLLQGGGQEGGMRSGTENLAGIYGFTLALEKRMANLETERANALEIKKYMVEGISQIRGTKIFPSAEAVLTDAYSPFILSASFPPIPGEVLARVMDDNGVAVSTGSACSAGKAKKLARVVLSQGMSDIAAASTNRFSWGPTSTLEEAEKVMTILKTQVDMLGTFSRRR